MKAADVTCFKLLSQTSSLGGNEDNKRSRQHMPPPGTHLDRDITRYPSTAPSAWAHYFATYSRNYML